MTKLLPGILSVLLLGTIVGAVALTVGVTLCPELFQTDEDHCLAAANRRRQDLDSREAALRPHILARQEAIQEVIAGDLTLLQAAERFADLNRRRGLQSAQLLCDQYPDCATDEERLCCQVIDHVAEALKTDARRDAVVRRLLRDFAAIRSASAAPAPADYR